MKADVIAINVEEVLCNPASIFGEGQNSWSIEIDGLILILVASGIFPLRDKTFPIADAIF